MVFGCRTSVVWAQKDGKMIHEPGTLTSPQWLRVVSLSDCRLRKTIPLVTMLPVSTLRNWQLPVVAGELAWKGRATGSIPSGVSCSACVAMLGVGRVALQEGQFVVSSHRSQRHWVSFCIKGSSLSDKIPVLPTHCCPYPPLLGDRKKGTFWIIIPARDLEAAVANWGDCSNQSGAFLACRVHA